MASVQQNLNVITRGQGIIAPADPGPNALEGLARLGATLLGTQQAYQQAKRTQTIQNRQDTEWEQSQKDRAYAEETRGVKNTLAAGLYGAAGGVDLEALPPTARALVDDASKAQKGTVQGSTPKALADLKIRDLITETLRDHPDQAANIFAYAQTVGLNDPLFREYNVAKSMEAAEDEQRVKGMGQAYKIGVELGYNPETTDRNTILNAGFEKLRRDADDEQRMADLEYRAKLATTDKAEQDLLHKEVDRTIMGYVSSDITSRFGVLSQNVVTLSQRALAEGKYDQFVLQIPSLVASAAANYKASVKARIAKGNGSPELYKQADDMVDAYVSTFMTTVTGNIEQNSQALKYITSKTNLELTQAAPLYHSMVQMFGQQTTNEALMGGLVDDATLAATSKELRGIDLTSPMGMASLMKARDVLNGDIAITQIKDPAQKATVIKMSKATVQSNQAAAFNNTPGAAEQWARGMRPILNATFELNPVTASRKDVITMGEVVYDPKNTAIVKRMTTQPDTAQEGKEILVGMRANAIKTLDTAVSENVNRDPNSYHHIIPNDNGEYYVAVDTRRLKADYDSGKFKQNQMMFYGPGVYGSSNVVEPSWGQVYRKYSKDVKASKEMVDTAASLNKAASFLVDTDSISDTKELGLNAREARLFYTKDQIPPDKLAKANKAQKAEGLSYDQQVSNTVNMISDFNVDVVSGTGKIDTTGPVASKIVSAAEAAGVDPNDAVAIAKLESSLNPNAKNDKSSAAGVFQFIDTTWNSMGGGDKMDADLNIKRGVELMAKNRISLTKTLGREPTGGELYLAHQQGAAGAKALLSAPDEVAADVLSRISENGKPIGISEARRRIKLNGGREDMTAREFAMLWDAKMKKAGG